MDVTKGMNMDFHESNQPKDTYRWATDWVAESFDSLTTELGNTYVSAITTAENSPFDRGFLPVGFIPKQNAVICFFVNNTGLGEIGVYLESTETYYTYLLETVSELGFDTNHTIRGLSKSNSNGDWVVVFNDRLNSPKIIIIDSITFGIDKYYPNYNVKQLELFPKTVFSDFTTSIVSGGSLEVAPYIPFIQYERIDGTTSSCFSSGEIIYINKEKTGVFEAGELGAISSKSIQITFEQDSTWHKVNIGLANVHTTECRIISSRIVTTGSIDVVISNFSGEILAGGLDNINILKPIYNKAHTQTAHQGYLYLGGVESESIEIPQSIVNTLSLNWTCKFIDPFEEIKTKGSVKSFQPNEVYSFMVRFWKDGTPTKWYHLKGREPKTYKTLLTPEVYSVASTPEINTFSGISETDANPSGTSYNYLTLDGAKVFHINDCIDYDSVTYSSEILQGEMSYWENVGETYNLYFKDFDLDVGSSVNFLDGKNVRHHKFPSKHYLNLAIHKKIYGTSLPTGISGTSTNVEFSDKSTLFTDKQPQLGVKIIQSTEYTDWLTASSITFDRIELSHTSRTNSDNTVVSEDLSHFGTYAKTMGEYSLTEGLPTNYDLDALGFTGGNFNSSTALSIKGDSDDFNQEGRLNGDFIKNEPAASQPDYYNQAYSKEILPNRQRIFNPEVFNDNDVINNLNTNIDYIRYEVLISNITNVVDSINFGGTPTFTSYESMQNLESGTIYPRFSPQSLDTNKLTNYPALLLTDQASRGLRQVGRHFLYLFDYTLSGNVPKDKLNGRLPEHMYDYNLESSISANTETKVVYNRGDFTFPTKFVTRQVKNSQYRVKGDVSTLNSSPLNSVTRKINYGGNNHLHLEFDDSITGSGNTCEITNPNPSLLSENNYLWYNSSIVKRKVPLYKKASSTGVTYYTRLFSPYHPFMKKLDTQDAFSKYTNNTFITTMMRYNPYIYTSFINKSVDICLKDGDTYYGDVFISEVNYLVNGFIAYTKADILAGDVFDNWSGAGINSVIYRFFAHTRQNQSQKRSTQESLALKGSFYPDKNLDYFKFDTNTVLPQAYTVDSDWNINNINHLQSVPFDSYSQYQNKFPYRILQSNPIIKESSIENWTTFGVLNYYEIAKEKGFISNLQGYDEQLIIHTVNTLLLTKGSTNLQQGQFNIVLGTSNIFDFPPNEIQLGDYLGTQHQGSCLLTPFGYVFYDSERRRMYILSKESGVKEISMEGLRLFFERYGKILDTDFNSGATWCNVCYDHKYRRILFSFPSGNDRFYTISYYPELNSWKSYHHYLPLLTFNTKNNIYGVSTELKTVKFNQPVNTSVFISGSGILTPTIDIPLHTMPIQTKGGIIEAGSEYLKFIQSFQWKTEVRNGFTENYKVLENETFTEALVRTNKQASKVRPLSFLNNLRKFNNQWQFNDFRDAVVRETNGNPTSENIVKTVVDNFDVIGNTETNPVKRFIDTFAVLRLKYTLNGNKRLTLFNIDWLTKRTNK